MHQCWEQPLKYFEDCSPAEEPTSDPASAHISAPAQVTDPTPVDPTKRGCYNLRFSGAKT